MMRRVFLDSNILVACYDSESNIAPDECNVAKSMLRALALDPEVVFVITLLVRYEVLRFIKWNRPEHFDQVKRILDSLTELDVTESISTLATNLYRLDQHECAAAKVERNINKRNFDVFHFASAKVNELELLTRNERDFAQLEALFLRLQT